MWPDFGERIRVLNFNDPSERETISRVVELINRSPYRELAPSPIRGTGYGALVYEEERGRPLGFLVIVSVPYIDSLVVDRSVEPRKRALIVGRLLRAAEAWVRWGVDELRRRAEQLAKVFGVPTLGVSVDTPTLVGHIWLGDREWAQAVTRKSRDGWIIYPNHILALKPLDKELRS